MSGLIKADGRAVTVDRFTGQRRAPASPALSPMAQALEEALTDNAALQRSLDAARGEARTAIADAREAGIEEGRRATEDDHAARLALIGDGLATARDQWDDRLDTLDTLAALLVRAALARMFADHGDLAELTMRSIAHRLDGLRRHSLVALRVSAHDFADEDGLAMLADRVGVTPALCAIDHALAAGECRLDLELGEVAIGVTDQARTLDRLLADLAEPGR